MTVKNRERLRPFDDPQAVALFLAASPAHPSRSREGPRPPRRKAVTRKWRRRSRFFRRSRSGSPTSPIWTCARASSPVQSTSIWSSPRATPRTANRSTSNCLRPQSRSSPGIFASIGHICYARRPTLCSPGRGAGRSRPQGFGAQIKDTVFRFSGLTVNPHLFRHAGAKIFLDQRPGQYEVVRQVLRHRSIETTTGFYAGAETRSAGQHFASVIGGLRDVAPTRKSGGASAAARTTVRKRQGAKA